MTNYMLRGERSPWGKVLAYNSCFLYFCPLPGTRTFCPWWHSRPGLLFLLCSGLSNSLLSQYHDKIARDYFHLILNIPLKLFWNKETNFIQKLVFSPSYRPLKLDAPHVLLTCSQVFRLELHKLNRGQMETIHIFHSTSSLKRMPYCQFSFTTSDLSLPPQYAYSAYSQKCFLPHLFFRNVNSLPLNFLRVIWFAALLPFLPLIQPTAVLLPSL